MKLIKRYGGSALVQHPATAEIPSMPLKALTIDDPDDFLPVEQIAERMRAFCLS